MNKNIAVVIKMIPLSQSKNSMLEQDNSRHIIKISNDKLSILGISGDSKSKRIALAYLEL